MRVDLEPDEREEERPGPDDDGPVHRRRVQVRALDGRQAQDRDHQRDVRALIENNHQQLQLSAPSKCRKEVTHSDDADGATPPAEVPRPGPEPVPDEEDADGDGDGEGEVRGDGPHGEDGADGDLVDKHQKEEEAADESIEPNGVDRGLGVLVYPIHVMFG